MNNKTELIELALKQKWHLFQLQPKSKVPLPGSNGFKDATNNPAVIFDLLDRNPIANWGLATGAKSGITVIDIDPRHGGDHSWEAIQDKFGPFPDTVEQQTGNGRQLFYQYDPRVGSSAGVGGFGGIDTRSDGGYVVMPPSIHPNGRAYTWLEEAMPGGVAIAKIPERFIAHISIRRKHYIPKPVMIEGCRNQELFYLGCKLRRLGLVAEAIRSALHIQNKAACVPPLGSSEVDKISANCSVVKETEFI